MKKLFVILASWLIGSIVAYIFFGLIAPGICGLIPKSEYKSLYDLAVYVLVAVFGGIEIPFVIGAIGTVCSTEIVEIVFTKEVSQKFPRDVRYGRKLKK